MGDRPAEPWKGEMEASDETELVSQEQACWPSPFPLQPIRYNGMIGESWWSQEDDQDFQCEEKFSADALLPNPDGFSPRKSTVQQELSRTGSTASSFSSSNESYQSCVELSQSSQGSEVQLLNNLSVADPPPSFHSLGLPPSFHQPPEFYSSLSHYVPDQSTSSDGLPRSFNSSQPSCTNHPSTPSSHSRHQRSPSIRNLTTMSYQSQSGLELELGEPSKFTSPQEEEKNCWLRIVMPSPSLKRKNTVFPLECEPKFLGPLAVGGRGLKKANCFWRVHFEEDGEVTVVGVPGLRMTLVKSQECTKQYQAGWVQIDLRMWAFKGPTLGKNKPGQFALQFVGESGTIYQSELFTVHARADKTPSKPPMPKCPPLAPKTRIAEALSLTLDGHEQATEWASLLLPRGVRTVVHLQMLTESDFHELLSTFRQISMLHSALQVLRTAPSAQEQATNPAPTVRLLRSKKAPKLKRAPPASNQENMHPNSSTI